MTIRKDPPKALAHMQSVIGKVVAAVNQAVKDGAFASALARGDRDVPANAPSPAKREINTFTFRFANGRILEVSIADLAEVPDDTAGTN